MPIMIRTKKSSVNYFMYFIHALVWALAYGLITYWIIFRGGAEEVALRAYVWNLVLITLVLSIDKVLLKRIEKRKEFLKKKTGRLSVHFMSFKASLYIFYIFTLVSSRVMLLLDFTMLGWDVDVVYSIRNYLLSVEYGLILLVAADKFIDQFIKDKKRMRELSEE